MSRTILGAGLLAGALLAAPALQAQTDPRLVAAVRQAQAGQVDSARAVLRRLAAGTPAADALYPEILYAIALTAADVTERERTLQRVTVEYPLSSWADDALLLLAESDYAGGNLPGAARDLERIRRDFPSSPILPNAALWAARTYFDMRNQRAACAWIVAGLRQGGADAVARAQLGGQARRCGPLIAASDTVPPAAAAPTDSPGAGIGADTAHADSAQAAAPTRSAAPVPSTPVAPARSDSARGGTMRADSVRAAPPPAPAGRFRVQLAAAASRREADEIVRGLASRDVEADVTEEKGYFKVRTGHFASRRDAQAEATRLRGRLGNGAFVVSE